MRKIILLIAVLLMAVPAMATNVDITCEVGGADNNEVTVSYETDDTLIRAFGLTITLTDPCVAITKVDVCDVNYRIYPGQIVIEDGEVIDYNTPYPPDDLGDANLAIEMGSLYTMDANYSGDPNAGYDMQPGSSGVLLKFYVDDPNGCFDVNEDPLSGGVVLEDPCEAAVVTSEGGCFEQDCIASTHLGGQGYTDWVSFGKPACWCYEHQCRGDADGVKQLVFWVYSNDLTILKSAYALPGTPPGNGICADIDHQKQLVFRVYSNDLAILKTYYALPSVPSCGSPPDADYNYWTTP